jgi:hypothetical protein
MLVFVTTAAHAYTHEQVVPAATDLDIRLMSYEILLEQRSPVPATYVFTDMDRLSPPDLMRAASCFRRLRARGMRALNDPAKSRSRAGLLRDLHLAGVNCFNAYRVEEGRVPDRWPVFLRVEGSHGYPASDLVHSRTELSAAVSRAVRRGAPLSTLIAIEYAAQPVRPGLFRKLSLFRIGHSSVAHTCVHEDCWLVKYGRKGIAPPELYEDELRIVTQNPYWPELRRAFEIAGLDYGRADFGLVDDKVQIYEINSNPHIDFRTTHPSPRREQSYREFRNNYLAALRALDRDRHTEPREFPVHRTDKTFR